MAKKQSNYLQRLALAQQNRDMTVRNHQRTFTLDIVTIALGRCGMNPDDLAHFRDVYMETERDYIDEINQDYYANGDKMLCYAKDRIDRALKEYVSEEMFVEYEKRYGA